MAREASHPAPLVAAQQEGGDFNAFGNLAPDGQVDVGEGSREAIASSAKTTAEQLKALGVGVNLAPNADVAVAGGPGQGRAFSDSPAKVASAVKATVRAVQRRRRGGGRRPVPGDRRGIAGPERRPGAGRALARGPARGRPQAVRGRGRRRDRAPAMQMSNAIYVAFDGVTPATLLPEAVKELRDRLDFDGAILSADLVATTATAGGTVGEAAVKALQAGVDMLVIPGGRAQQDQAFRAVVAAVRSGALSPARVRDALERIAALRAFTREAREPVRAEG